MSRFPQGRRALLISAISLAFAGCASVPQPITQDEIKTVAAADRQKARADMEPLTGELTLADAVARGLKYNLDHRTRMMEQALASGQLEAGGYDMLPRVLASAGYQSRSNDSNSYAPDPRNPGSPSSVIAPISADRTHYTTDLGLSWNILDFGISYYNSKQNADRVLVAAERRRKAMNQLIQNIRTAFWRVASADRLHKEVTDTIRQAEAALVDSRQVSAERIKAPVDALRFQRMLLENLRTLEGIERDLAAARIELAQLINVPTGTPIQVVEPSQFSLEENMLSISIERMEELAIENNADLREQFYNARISATETRKALLRLFPAISVSYNGKNDSNSFLVNQSWNEAAAQLSINLINLLSGPSQMEVAEAGARLAEQRRTAMQMAVLTQVHLARQDFDTALRQFRRADAIWDVDRQIFEQTSLGAAEQTQSQIAKVASRTAAILSLLRRYQALAQAHGAVSRLDASLGLEPAIDNLDQISLADLRKILIDTLTSWSRMGKSPSPAAEPTPLPIPAPAAPAPAATGRHLSGVRFIGNDSVSSDELAAAYVSLMGNTLSEAQRAQLPEPALAVYRAKGRTRVVVELAGFSESGLAILRIKNLQRP